MASGDGHVKYCESEIILESDCPRITPKFVNMFLRAHTLAIGLDSLRLRFSSQACLLCYSFSLFVCASSVVNDAPSALSTGEPAMNGGVRVEWNSHHKSRKSQILPSRH